MLSISVDPHLSGDWHSVIEREARFAFAENPVIPLQCRINLSRSIGRDSQDDVYVCSVALRSEGRKIAHVAIRSNSPKECIRHCLQRADGQLQQHLEKQRSQTKASARLEPVN